MSTSGYPVNESSNTERIARAICQHLSLDDDATEAYARVALSCAEYYKNDAENDTQMVAQLVTESEGNDLLSAMLNHGKLLVYGTRIQIPEHLKVSYYVQLIAHITITTAAFYKQGYDDALAMESPEAFDDFISGLGLNDSSDE